jgi:CHASE2 domain-containing sensor protein
VIVAIDRESLDRLGPWPWPRRRHATALDRLRAAGARRIAFDIDLSGRTNAADDQALADAIGRTPGVILPVFRQGRTASAGKHRPVHHAPYAPFALGARLATVTIKLAADGRARRYPARDDWNGATIPGLANLLAGGQTARQGRFFLDYGIQPDTVPRLSYIDVLNGEFPAEAVKGKTVIVGAMEAGLGDMVPVPVYGILSGPLVHALAFESLVQGRDVYGKTRLFIVIAAFLLAFSAGQLVGKISGRTGPPPPCRVAARVTSWRHVSENAFPRP